MRHLPLYLLFAVAALQPACASAPTQLLVEVNADEDVRADLKRIKVFTYSPDATDAKKPTYQQLFSLQEGSSSKQTFPFSFGIERGQDSALKLVVAGYTTTAANAEPVIERKILASFEEGREVKVDVRLSSACYMRALQCSDLDKTCTGAPAGEAAPGDCVSIELASTAQSNMQDAGPAPISPQTPICPSENSCSDDAYPCVGSTSSGYTCLGQVAEWPMPDRQLGSKFQPSYDTTTIPGVVIDRVTGLYWQRELPDRYVSCTGSFVRDADSCTAAEARTYCEQLRLAGGGWRLPSKIELESLIDTTQSSSSIDPDAFPGTPKDYFWTGSPSRADKDHSWVVNFSNGFTGNHSDDLFQQVRCVRSVLTRNGTPADRFNLTETTALDQRTSLEWQRASAPADTIEAATEACKNQGDRWRLPTLKELLTLVDPTQAGPAFPRGISSVEGTATFNQMNWASDELSGSITKTGVLSIGLGATWAPIGGPEDKFEYHARCVR